MRIRAVVFDWAGTVVDYGCHAPVVVLQKIFGERGITLTPDESRHGMGLLKIDQIRGILALPRVRQAWTEVTRHDPGERDVRELFESFIPVQMDCIEAYSDVIEGVPELVEKLRSAGVRIGSTTGYTRPIAGQAAAKGRSPGLCTGLHCDAGRSGQRTPASLDDLREYEAAGRLSAGELCEGGRY